MRAAEDRVRPNNHDGEHADPGARQRQRSQNRHDDKRDGAQVQPGSYQDGIGVKAL